ncbi:MAG: hypoxanthine phosphoribosyltransferase [Chloroflexota bacterium]|nr:hypoxanthine phosphoribosyltransferase [Chloroflexota bacterium]
MEFLRPSRCFTCRHHRLGEYDPDADYQEHWCDIEENERPGWFPGMHLDGCVFSAMGMALCPVYDRIETLESDFVVEQRDIELESRPDPGFKKPKVLITKDEIALEVKRLAGEINRDYKGKRPLLLGILKGSFIFLADLVRSLDTPVEVDFVRLASYGSAKVSSGRVRMVHGLRSNVKGRDVILVDDIVDTGLALSYLVNYVKKRKPASVKLCALLNKPSRREIDIDIDYLGITIPDKFVVGYGLDCNEEYRHLPDICVVED